MPTFDRRFLFGSTAAALPPMLLLSLLIARPRLIADAWEVPCFKRAFPEERRQEAELDRQRERVNRRIDTRRAVLGELAEGRLTLPETAARFRDLDQNSPDFNWDAYRRAQPGLSDDERHIREVIAQLRALAPLGAGPTEELARRLEAELADLLARGALRLPDAKE